MPTCRRCKATFPIKVIIDGKKRNLGSRKFCLECSPFGSRNTRVDLDAPAPKRSYSSAGYGSYAYVKRFRERRKQQCIDYKGGKCERCGYNKSNRALHFHHVDPTKKDFTIAKQTNREWSAVKKELDKCVLLCANCHAEEHDRLDQEN